MTALIRPLDRTDQVEHFLSDGAHLNMWFHRRAKPLHFSKEVRTYVLVCGEEIYGFYAVQTYGYYQEMSGVLLVKLAVSLSRQRSGYGRQLLMHCFQKASQLAEIVGCQGLVVHSKENAIPFYEKFGLVMFDPIMRGLFIGIEDINKRLDAMANRE